MADCTKCYRAITGLAVEVIGGLYHEKCAPAMKGARRVDANGNSAPKPVKVTSTMKSFLLAVHKSNGERTDGFCFETKAYCINANLVVLDKDVYLLTSDGKIVVQEELQKLEIRRKKSRLSARARHEAYASVGMVRTRSGTYE
jgi:hypothetical protein